MSSHSPESSSQVLAHAAVHTWSCVALVDLRFTVLTFEPSRTLAAVPLNGVGETHALILAGIRQTRVTLGLDGDVWLLCIKKTQNKKIFRNCLLQK